MTRMNQAVLIAAGLLAPFFFPWKFALFIAFALSLFVPFGGIATGIIADALYFGSGAAPMPWATIAAVAASLIAYGVRSFMKTRIIGT